MEIATAHPKPRSTSMPTQNQVIFVGRIEIDLFFVRWWKIEGNIDTHTKNKLFSSRTENKVNSYHLPKYEVKRCV